MCELRPEVAMLLNLSCGMVPLGDLTSESWPTRDQAKIRALDASVLEAAQVSFSNHPANGRGLG